MTTIEKLAAIITAAVINAAIFAAIAYGLTGNSVAAITNAIVFIPFMLGPPLILSFRPTTSRVRFYAVIVLISFTPFSNLLFLAALIASVIPQRRSVHAVDRAQRERSLTNICHIAKSISGGSAVLFLVLSDFKGHAIGPFGPTWASKHALSSDYPFWVREVQQIVVSSWPLLVVLVPSLVIWFCARMGLRNIKNASILRMKAPAKVPEPSQTS
jgi:hypothetical protein